MHDFIAFIAYGHKLIDAPASDIPAAVGLTTWRIEGRTLSPVYEALKTAPGVDQIARFGSAIHVSGKDPEQLEAALAPYREQEGLEVSPAKTGLEEAFIYLMTGREGGQ